ncbi:BrnA antitoxin family protein [Salipiger sp. PrR002]|uniref:BrnA antitoxin family protein n=1 Tax=Salipiger sp. PrR002 TaxID=2706489 RepID=UPI001F229AB5|nr:BrnA antitoxin family protein [Salipiger sp. PrR002]
MRRKLTEMTKTERMHFQYAVDAMEMVERDLLDRMWDRRGCPPDWHAICRETDRRDLRRTRCTIALDADVVKFFKALGPGYQSRINRVLRAFMHYRLAKVLDGPDTSDFIMRPELVEEQARKERTRWGDTQNDIVRTEVAPDPTRHFKG